MEALRRGVNVVLTFVVAATGYACDGNITKPSEVPPSEQNYWITGRVTEAIALPLAGAIVTIGAGSPQERSTTTTPNGRYLIQDVRGPQTVVFSADGYKPVSKQVELDVVDHRIDLDVEIEPVVAPADIAGVWRATLQASEPCVDDFPVPLRTRKYIATIAQQGARMSIDFSGADFEGATHFEGLVHGNRMTVSLGDWDRPGPLERVASDRFISIWADVTAVADGPAIRGTQDAIVALLTAPRDGTLLGHCDGVGSVTFER